MIKVKNVTLAVVITIVLVLNTATGSILTENHSNPAIYILAETGHVNGGG